MIRIGDTPPKPSGLKTAVIEGKDPYERAAAIDRFVSAAKGRPSNELMVVSGERADWAMPAAAWAARKGDSVLMTRRDSHPRAPPARPSSPTTSRTSSWSARRP